MVVGVLVVDAEEEEDSGMAMVEEGGMDRIHTNIISTICQDHRALLYKKLGSISPTSDLECKEKQLLWGNLVLAYTIAIFPWRVLEFSFIILSFSLYNIKLVTVYN